jgi:hypothetical protein
VGQISKAGSSWVDKVQLFGALAEALHGSGSSPHPDVAANVDRVAACLLDGIGKRDMVRYWEPTARCAPMFHVG